MLLCHLELHITVDRVVNGLLVVAVKTSIRQINAHPSMLLYICYVAV